MLSEPQLQRYSRQLLLPEIGGAGQERLLAARVEVEGEGVAAETLRAYLAAAGVETGVGGQRVGSTQGARWVLDDVGIAWAAEGGPCGDCLSATLAEVPRPPDWARAAVVQASGALAASQVLLWLAGSPPKSSGAYLAWPEAARRPVVPRSGCSCG